MARGEEVAAGERGHWTIVIRLERPSPPAVLREGRPADERALQSHLRRSGSRPPELNPFIYGSEVYDALVRMSQGRCAYCERDMASSPGGSVTHHRPPWGAVDADGTPSLDHYWWLAYNWENLLPACAECIRAKGNRFPVDAAKRASRGQRLSSERPLLLDPCEDEPDEHLLFQPDGTVVGSTPRGGTTVDVLALNRSSLVSARQAVAAKVLAGEEPDTDEFQGLRRQLRQLPAHAKPKQTAMPRPRDHYDLESAVPMGDVDKLDYYSTVRWIEQVRIRNFRPIRDLDLDFTASSSEHGPWRVLLGENGSGKSSVLQAIALTLIGGTYRRELGIRADKFLRYGASEGSVEVRLTGSPEPLRMTFRAGSPDFEGPEGARVLLLGYGATRLLPRPGAALEPPRSGMTRVNNLFNPFLAMTDPTEWMLGLPPKTFSDVALGLTSLLDLGPRARLIADHDLGVVQVREGRQRSSIEELSDGYQSMLVLACDVMNTVLSMWQHVSLAEGIVLIDELGAHLHPRWRMRIVKALRTLLPRVQFVVSTHDPLCLRGVLDGEVTVIRRNPENHVVAITDLPSVQGMRVEQLLTSEHFGLGSTNDPDVDDLWAEYYQLMGIRRPRSAERARLDDVRRRLGQLDELGRSERERLLLNSADAYIARRRAEGDATGPTSTKVEAELAAIWAAQLPVPDGQG
jgi:uncharacterized protein (TIGR02646 family)